jgi:hypothetical protein
MTDKQINAAIAEACGIVGKDQYGPLYQTPDGWVVDCPQFATDLNAMHDAEKMLSNANMYVMEVQLKRVLNAREFYFHATARQRAEAFLRTLGKWEKATDKDSFGGAGGVSTYGGNGLGIAGVALPPETQITVNGKTFCLADIDKEMTE